MHEMRKTEKDLVDYARDKRSDWSDVCVGSRQRTTFGQSFPQIPHSSLIKLPYFVKPKALPSQLNSPRMSTSTDCPGVSVSLLCSWQVCGILLKIARLASSDWHYSSTPLPASDSETTEEASVVQCRWDKEERTKWSLELPLDFWICAWWLRWRAQADDHLPTVQIIITMKSTRKRNLPGSKQSLDDLRVSKSRRAKYASVNQTCYFPN